MTVLILHCSTKQGSDCIGYVVGTNGNKYFPISEEEWPDFCGMGKCMNLCSLHRPST